MSRVIGLEIFLLALAGSLIFPKKNVAGLFIGLTIGYLLYGFTFSYHVSTHDYYHLPLMVQVPLGLALVFKALVNAIEKEKMRFSRLIIAAVLDSFHGTQSLGCTGNPQACGLSWRNRVLAKFGD